MKKQIIFTFIMAFIAIGSTILIVLTLTSPDIGNHGQDTLNAKVFFTCLLSIIIILMSYHINLIIKEKI